MRKEMAESKTAGRTIQARLFESFKQYPDNIAVECEGNTLTYHQLERQSNFIANWLIAQGILRESFIGIIVNDKISLVTVILGIIKAGCVFVPLDSHYPDRRLGAMIRSSEIPYIIIDADKEEKLKSLRRHLPFHLDIITINEKFYIPGSRLQLKRFQDKYKLNQEEKTRYKRQMLLDGWGIEGQERLKGSTVFVAGAGGSGSPLIQQLALCGFGTIIICDFDEVELSNLNRQSLHHQSRIGMNKALSAKMTVERMNPHIKVIARPEKITRENVFELVGDAEVIFDNVDSLEAKSYLSQCAVARGIPHIISSMIHINSYVCIFHTPYTPCFHCLYDKRKIEDITKAKALNGPYKVIPNSVASPALHLSTGFAVNEAIKILLGFGKPAYNIYFHINQYGSPDIVNTNGYKQITYPFNHHFRALSRDQGFDWDTGWHGRHLEEIMIRLDPRCPVCSHTRGLGAEGTGTGPTGIEIHHEESPHQDFYHHPPQINYLPADKINIYFTSGTTGQPKAVLGKNEGMTHFIAWEINEFEIHEGIRVSQMTSQCHDPFLRDIFVPLCAGGTICVPDSKETLLDSRRIKEWLETAKVNLVHCTPGLFKIMSADGLQPDNYQHLEYVLMAGEKILPQDLEKWYPVMGNRVQLVNVYGPTETTLAKLFYRIKPQDIRRDTIPIGSPIPGSKVIILDKELNICGPGEVGEIYIRTPFRSYGYYNDQALNAEKFMKNPFSHNPEDIIYKTGDLGKINREGYIEFVGREDRQVKVRGFRVELDEIEKRLRTYPGVEEAVVLYRRTRTGNYILCSYFNGNGEVTVPLLKEYLNQELPDYMVPSFHIKMEKFPLNTNGKIDYKALPEPDAVDRNSYIAPKNENEKKMVKIWTGILGIEKIGIHDGFLDMGGNSLNAMNLTTQVYREFAVNLQLSFIFENPTVADLVTMVEASSTSIYQHIKPVEKREYYLLSSAQQRMYLLREFAGEDDISYNQPKPLLLKGEVNSDRLEEAFKQLIIRHDSLRTGFETIAGQPVQRIQPEVEFEIEYHSTERKAQSAGRNEECYAPCAMRCAGTIKDFIRPFDLSRAPLLRVGLVKTAKYHYILIFDIHHIISDGITTGIFIDEMMKLYHNESLPRLPLQYKDYALWQQDILQTGALKEQENHWLEVFKGEIPVLNLMTDLPRPLTWDFAGAQWHFKVNPLLLKGLEQHAKNFNASLYMVLLAAFNILLYKYSQDEDIVVGSPIAGRHHGELQHIPGVFINTLAMRNQPRGNITFAAFLEEVKQNSFAAYENQDYPFEELVEKLNLNRDLNRNPLFDIMFIFQNIHMKPLQIEGLNIEPYPFAAKTSKFDISLVVLETEKDFDFSIEYSTQLYQQVTIERFSRHLSRILNAVLENPGIRLSRIEMLMAEEKKQLLVDFNGPDVQYPGKVLIDELFAEIVESRPGKTALVFNDKTISFGELNREAGRLAAFLREQGIRPGDIVGLMVKRSFEMVIGILAVLKAGGAYLPIDPQYPEERKKYMLMDSGVKLLICNCKEENEPPVKPGDIEIIHIHQEKIYRGNRGGPGPANPGAGLLYCIYTSGSTGNPKGVLLEQKALVNLVRYQLHSTCIEFSRVLQFTTISFDVASQEIFSTLLAGGTLVLIEEETQKDVPRLFQVINTNKIGTLFLAAAFLQWVINQKDYPELFPIHVKHIITAGEQIILTTAFKKYLRENKVYLHNHYGPSEAHVVTTLTLEPQEELPDLPSIGKPVANTGIYILNKEDQLQPPGVPGELYISGIQVGTGYLNNPELTADKFDHDLWDLQDYHDEYNRSPGSYMSYISNRSSRSYKSYILYRTGDLCRWLADGNIEFLGRIDRQVKIKGFRIEPGEIENRLLEIDHIKQAVVVDLCKENSENVLCAYITAGKTLEISFLRNCMSEHLPAYMIPSYFVQLEDMPLTPSGKVDRKALPAPVIQAGKTYLAPRDHIEETLVKLWSEVLGIEKHKIGVTDNFFELGGHSLKATILAAKIHKELHVKLSLAEILNTPFIRGLALKIPGAERAHFLDMETVEEKEYYELSYNQKRLWVIYCMDPNSSSYHMPGWIHLNHAVNTAALTRALSRVFERHESFRTGFKEVSNQPVQFIRRDVQLPFTVIDLSHLAHDQKQQKTAELIEQTIKPPFDLQNPPLFRSMLIKRENEAFVLVYCLHHIISDGWSNHILQEEFNFFYKSYLSRQEPRLDPLQFHYRDFSTWHNRRIQDLRLKEKSHRYWSSKLEHGFPTLNLPNYYSRDMAEKSGAGFRCTVNQDIKNRLHLLAGEHNTTLFTVLFSMFNLLLFYLSGQQEVALCIISAGREHISLNNIVGYFTTPIIVKNRVDLDEDFDDLLSRVNREVLEAFQHQSYPLELVADEMGIAYPNIPIAFNLINMQDISLGTEMDSLSPGHTQVQRDVKFDIVLYLTEYKNGIEIKWHYQKSLFKPEGIENIAGKYLKLMSEITGDQ